VSEWIPLLQSLVWPVFLGVLIYCNRSWLAGVLDAIKQRIEEGGEFGIGPQGLTMGAAPRLPDEPEKEDIIDDGSGPVQWPELVAIESSIEKEEEEDPVKGLHLVHRTGFWKMRDGRPYYRVVVSLDAKNPSALREIQRVIYYLHRTFKNPVREVTDPRKNFALKTAAWGEFTIHADVYLKGREDSPLRLSRYLTLQ
jgi:hypothetical protein